jgi:23S rRNA (uracil1939-C5)-methyltransferase
MVLMNIGDIAVPIPADAFLQASAEAQALITALVIDATKNISPIVDLFCGIGTYSFPMSERARVHAVDNDGAMIDNIRGLSPKVSVQKRDLFLHPLTAAELAKYNAAVINPPRMGSAAQIAQLAKSGIKKIIMVSCNHATWSRDAKALKNSGYQLQSATVIDQFVYSPHVELVSVFKLLAK